MHYHVATILFLSVIYVSNVQSAHPGVVHMKSINEHLIGRPDGHDRHVEPIIGQHNGHNLYEYLFKYNKQWSEFKHKFSRKYANFHEEIRRMIIFVGNLLKIEKHNALYNAGKKSYYLGLNDFADMSHNEFLKLRTSHATGCFKGPRSNTGSFYMEPTGELPKSVDWRKKGAVTPVKDQKQCGSCWSFSTTGSLEGQHFRKAGKLLSFSEQQLVDCSTSYGNMGCNGGLMDSAFKYIKAKGIELETDYPYKARDMTCKYDRSKVAGNVTGFVDVKEGSETQLKSAVANVGPVSVAIDASHSSFQLYRGGVYDEEDCSTEQLDHGVLVVGYGTSDDNLDYWIVKNSWNTHWGVQGYILMSRNKKNQCGIASSASYPLV